jgi:dihydrofolate reductase
MPELTLVAAMARNRVIGQNGRMPWHLPADLAHFKRLTMGHPIVMGRKTFAAIGRALPGRRNIVISRSAPSLPPGVLGVRSLDEAIANCSPDDQIMVIGGGEVYRLALDQARSLELTLIDAAPEGDTWFPAVAPCDWQLTRMSVRPADQNNVFRLAFCRFERA